MLILDRLNSDLPAQRRDTISAKALRELREAIVTTRIKPGDSLSETDVAQAMGISRTPVREAFARLFEEELIEISPQKGTRVSLIDMARVKEAIFIRATLESAVIANGNSKLSTSILSELRMSIGELQDAWERGDLAALHRADMSFHATLMNGFGMHRAWTASQHVAADMTRVQFLVGLKPEHVEAIIDEHRGIASAVEEGDFTRASRLMAAHVSQINFDQIELLAANAHFFRNVEGVS